MFDAGGKRYLDACSGAFVSNLGHGVPEIADAMAAQAKRLAYVSGMTLTNTAVEEFAAELASLSPGDLDRVYPLSSGSDAVEAALKLARQYWIELGGGRADKWKIVALSPSYHGNTLLALSASAREHYKKYFGGWLVDVVRAPAPYPYRCACGGRPPLCRWCNGDAVEEAIVGADPRTVAALILEPVGGSSTGASLPPSGYLQRIREICNRHDVLFIADEILVGAGRTGRWSALEHDGVIPDIQVLGKGISAGFAPLAAVVAPDPIVNVLANGSGSLLHAQTFSHHAVSCAAGTATLRYMSKYNLVQRCARMGDELHDRLAELRGVPHVGDVRGRGLLVGIEFVEDVATKEPFPRAMRFAESLTRAALDAGLIVWPNVGHANGTDGDLVMIAPPYTVSSEEIGEILSRLADAIRAATRALAVES